MQQILNFWWDFTVTTCSFNRFLYSISHHEIYFWRRQAENPKNDSFEVCCFLCLIHLSLSLSNPSQSSIIKFRMHLTFTFFVIHINKINYFFILIRKGINSMLGSLLNSWKIPNSCGHYTGVKSIFVVEITLL